MCRKRIVVGLIAFGFILIASACGVPTPFADGVDEPELEETEEVIPPTGAPTTEPSAPPTETPTLAPTSTAAPSETEVGVPARLLVVLDGASDGVDCVNGKALETTPPESDILKVLLDGGAESVQIQVGYAPEIDLAAAIAALNLPFSIQVGIADPEFPLPPVDPVAWSVDFQNATYLFVWLSSPEPIASNAAVYRDGAWSLLPAPSPATIEITSNFTATITIPNSALPQAGSLYVNTVINNRICDAAGADEQGAAVLFEAGVDGFVFIKQEE